MWSLIRELPGQNNSRLWGVRLVWCTQSVCPIMGRGRPKDACQRAQLHHLFRLFLFAWIAQQPIVGRKYHGFTLQLYGVLSNNICPVGAIYHSLQAEDPSPQTTRVQLHCTHTEFMQRQIFCLENRRENHLNGVSSSPSFLPVDARPQWEEKQPAQLLWFHSESISMSWVWF